MLVPLHINRWRRSRYYTNELLNIQFVNSSYSTDQFELKDASTHLCELNYSDDPAMKVFLRGFKFPILIRITYR